MADYSFRDWCDCGNPLPDSLGGDCSSCAINKRLLREKERLGVPNVTSTKGRWPANVLLDEEAGRALDGQSGVIKPHGKPARTSTFGGASRFFYCAKASKRERGEGNTHPTVKPQALLQYLAKLITPPNGLILDPFNGSGSMAIAAIDNGFKYIGIEKEKAYVDIANGRIEDHIFEKE